MIFNHRISTFYPFLLSQEQGNKKHDLNHSNGKSEMKEFVLVPKKRTASIIHTNIHCQILTFRISELVQFYFCKHSTSQKPKVRRSKPKYIKLPLSDLDKYIIVALNQ